MSKQRDIEELGPDASAVRQAYEQLPRREPPAHVDRRIRAAAADAVARRRRPVWLAPVALAATVLLSFGLVMRLALPPKQATQQSAPDPIAALEVAEKEAAAGSGSARQVLQDVAPSPPGRDDDQTKVSLATDAAQPATEARTAPTTGLTAPAADTAGGNRLRRDSPAAAADSAPTSSALEQAPVAQRTQPAGAEQESAGRPDRTGALFSSPVEEQRPSLAKSEAAAVRVTTSADTEPPGCAPSERRDPAAWLGCMRALRDAGDDALAAEVELWQTRRPGELLPSDLRENP